MEHFLRCWAWERKLSTLIKHLQDASCRSLGQPTKFRELNRGGSFNPRDIQECRKMEGGLKPFLNCSFIIFIYVVCFLCVISSLSFFLKLSMVSGFIPATCKWHPQTNTQTSNSSTRLKLQMTTGTNPEGDREIKIQNIYTYIHIYTYRVIDVIGYIDFISLISNEIMIIHISYSSYLSIFLVILVLPSEAGRHCLASKWW